MDFIIRTCVLSDAAFISKLNNDQMGYKYSIEETAKKITLILSDNRQRIFVAENNGVIGYIHVSEYELLYAPKMINVLGIAVSKEYQKQGIGSALLSEAEKWAKSVNAVGVRLSSGNERTEAHAFYNKRGYYASKIQTNFKKTI